VPEEAGLIGTGHVSLRETRESAYRALVAHGASHGEAAGAAEQVLDAEIHHGTGLAALLADLAAPAWPPTGMTVTRHQTGSSVILVLAGPDRSSALRQGCLLTELHASQQDHATVVCSEDRYDADATFDALLLDAASISGRCVAVTGVAPGGVATSGRAADRSGGVGPVEPADVLPDGLGPLLARLLPLGGLAVVRPRQLRAAAGWRTAEVRDAVRREAAWGRLLIERRTWDAVHAAARRFLVPDLGH
jgi:hypothetical protein